MLEAASAPQIPETLAEATRHQPRAALALTAALAAPGHAYLFRGPRGSGKAAAARAFAAELLPGGATDPGGPPPPGTARPLPASRPRLASPAGRPAPGRGRPRVGDPRRQPQP